MTALLVRSVKEIDSHIRDFFYLAAFTIGAWQTAKALIAINQGGGFTASLFATQMALFMVIGGATFAWHYGGKVSMERWTLWLLIPGYVTVGLGHIAKGFDLLPSVLYVPTFDGLAVAVAIYAISKLSGRGVKIERRMAVKRRLKQAEHSEKTRERLNQPICPEELRRIADTTN